MKLSLTRLALWLTWPSIVGEFAPLSPFIHNDGDEKNVNFNGVQASQAASAHVGEARSRFQAAVDNSVGEYERLAVSLSGGLDSFAVFLAARSTGKDVIPLVLQMTDDEGNSNIPVVTKLLTAAGHTSPPIIVGIDALPLAKPDFDVRGPRLDALPFSNRALAEHAASLGCDAMLAGNGSDELLGTPRYLLGELASAFEFRKFGRYFGDTVLADRRAFKYECMAIAARLAPRRLRAISYFATSWPELVTVRAPDVVAARFRPAILEYTEAWIASSIKFHQIAHSTWAEMDAWEAVHPIHPLAATGPLPLVNPFLAASFRAWVGHVPLADRYNPEYQYPYWRQKSVVLRLIPESARWALPREKATYGQDLAIHIRKFNAADLSILYEIGLVDPKAVKTNQDVMVLTRLGAIARWVEDALELDHTIQE